MGSSHILLVEPDRILARAYAKSLAKVATVHLAHTAQDAVHQADAHTPDLIILELQMPRHNGVELLYELRSYPEWQSIPVILHSMVPIGHIGMSAEALVALGIVNHLYKPTTSLHQLRREVAEALAVTA